MGVDTIFYKSLVLHVGIDDEGPEILNMYLNSPEAKEFEAQLHPCDWEMEHDGEYINLTPNGNAHRGTVDDWLPWLSFLLKYIFNTYEIEDVIGQLLYQTSYGDAESGILTPVLNENSLTLIQVNVNDEGDVVRTVHNV
jgi:hypothetical protein